MAAWRTLGSLVVLLAAAGAGRAQPYPLAEEVRPGDCFRVRLDMKLTGEMRVFRDGKSVSLPLEAAAAHEFTERVLALAETGLPAKVARAYDRAAAGIRAARDQSQRSLRPDRRLVVAQRQADVPLAYCPAGPLTREELELTAEHFDTLALTGLLPGKPVGAGDTWNVPNPVAQALCGFDGLTEQQLACKLEEVSGDQARVSVTGPAAGISLGAVVKLTVEASYRYDLKGKRLVALEWKQKDERDQGPASPASTVQTVTTLTRAPAAQPESLNDVALVNVPPGFEAPSRLTNLLVRDPKGRYDLVYPREWQMVGLTEEHLVMRFLERGDFVAQVTVTPWTPAGKGRHLTPEQFRAAMHETPGWEPAMDIQAGEVPSGDDRWVYRLSASGRLNGSEVLQVFYLVASPEGEQVVLVFTMTPKQAERLGTRDLSLAGSLAFPGK